MRWCSQSPGGRPCRLEMICEPKIEKLTIILVPQLDQDSDGRSTVTDELSTGGSALISAEKLERVSESEEGKKGNEVTHSAKVF